MESKKLFEAICPELLVFIEFNKKEDAIPFVMENSMVYNAINEAYSYLYDFDTNIPAKNEACFELMINSRAFRQSELCKKGKNESAVVLINVSYANGYINDEQYAFLMQKYGKKNESERNED